MATRDLNVRSTTFEAGSNQLVSKIPKATVPRVEGWNDEKLMELRRTVSFSKICQSRVSLKRILVRFYKLYLYGLVSKEDNVVGIVAEASAIARTQSDAVWPDEIFSNRPFYTSPRSSGETLISMDLEDIPQLVYIIPGMTEEAKRRYAESTTSYTMDHAANFRHTIIRIINLINPALEATDSELSLIQLTGFLALTLWRASTKNRDQLSNAFLKTRYRTNLTSLAGWPVGSAFCPPCTQCINLVTGSLQKGLTSTAHMFILLASEYVRSRDPNHPNESNARLLSAAVLTHTARSGLGIIQLLEHATIATTQKWSELAKLSYLNTTADSWDLIKQFFLTYLRKDELQYGYNWARIINDGYLRDYSPKEMLPLAGIFAGIIEQHQGPGIWDTAWAKGHVEELSEMRDYGRTVFEMTKSSLETVVALTDNSREVLIRVRQLAASRAMVQTDAAIIARSDL